MNSTLARKLGAQGSGNMSAATVAKWTKAVGKRVNLDGVGFGTLAFFGETTEGENQCGIHLEEAKGEGDGYGYFECPEGHCFFTTMDTLTRVGADGKPLKKKKAGTPAKKKFESPPSLRKTIGKGKAKPTSTKSTPKSTPKSSPRSSPASLRKAKPTPSTSSGHSRPKRASTLGPNHHSTTQHGRPGRKNSTPAANIDPEMLARPNAPIARKKKTPSASSAAGSDGTASPTPDGSGSGDGSADGGASVAAVPGEDWMDKAKRLEKEKADAAAREKEEVELAAQEARQEEAYKRQAAEDAELQLKQELLATEAAAAKEERANRKVQEQNERQARREDAKRIAMAEIAEAEEANARSQQELEQRTKALQEKRKAQKARIAMLMSKVKMKPDSAAV